MNLVGLSVQQQTLSDFFFFNDTATTEIYTLSLHDALPISGREDLLPQNRQVTGRAEFPSMVPAPLANGGQDRKSTRLNSSHSQISYAVFCLKKKKNQQLHTPTALRRSDAREDRDERVRLIH